MGEFSENYLKIMNVNEREKKVKSVLISQPKPEGKSPYASLEKKTLRRSRGRIQRGRGPTSPPVDDRSAMPHRDREY